MSAEQRQPVTRSILADLEERTMKIIKENKDVLLRITEILADEETLSGDILRNNLLNVAVAV